jgi:DHA1 family bicyclomycin/chloramphenicol resistance-like MFS transporter
MAGPRDPGAPSPPPAGAGFLRLALVLGLLSAIGPFAIDMYLPALPSIGRSLGADAGAVQLSLTVFFAALAVGQIVYGPVADMAGRKPPLYFGLALFTVASVGCALAPDVETLVAWRFAQGLGASAGAVVPRAIVRDLYTGNEAARLMSLLLLVFSVSPILAPLAGSLVTEAVGWRGVFWAVAAAAVVGLALLAFTLPETRPAAERRESSVGGALAGYAELLRDRRFLGLTFIGAFGLSSFFAYLANSSFVMIEHYGLSSRGYSLAFSINAVSFIGVSQANGWLARRFGLRQVVRIGALGHAAVMAALLGLWLLGVDRLDALATLLFVGFGFLGMVIPTAAVLALDDHGAIAGTAAALMGTLQFVVGAAVIAAAGRFADGSALPMVACIAGCAVAALAFAGGTLGLRRR